MMRSKAAMLAACVLWTAPVYAQETVDPSGVWLRDDGNARVEIAPCGRDICATNLWIGDTSGGEEVGHRLVMALKPQSASTLAGTAYDPQRKLSYSITVEVRKGGLTTRGCVLGGLLCRNVNWTPAN